MASSAVDCGQACFYVVCVNLSPMVRKFITRESNVHEDLAQWLSFSKPGDFGCQPNHHHKTGIGCHAKLKNSTTKKIEIWYIKARIQTLNGYHLIFNTFLKES